MVSNDPSEGCTGIVMSRVYVIGSKNTKSKRFKFLAGQIVNRCHWWCRHGLLGWGHWLHYWAMSVQFTADLSLPKISTGFGMHPDTSSIGAGGLSPVLKCQGIKLATQLPLVVKFWKSSYTSSTPYTLMTHQETHLPVDRAECCTEISVTFSNQFIVMYQKTSIFINTAVRTTDYAKRDHTAYRWLYLHGNVEWCSSTVSGHYEISAFTPTT